MANGTSSKDPDNSENTISLAQFRALFGLPQGHDTLNPQEDDAQHQDERPPSVYWPTVTVTATTRARFLTWSGFFSSPPTIPRHPRTWTEFFTLQPGQPLTDEESPLLSAIREYPTSVYYALVQEESDQLRLFHLYNFITYSFLVLQLISAALITLFSSFATASPGLRLSRTFTIVVAALGAFSAVLTGVLSLLKGQGLPLRLLQFASRLRQVREKIEFYERALRARTECPKVTCKVAMEVWQEYQDVIKERDINRPNAWASISTKRVDRNGINTDTGERQRSDEDPGNQDHASEHV